MSLIPLLSPTWYQFLREQKLVNSHSDAWNLWASHFFQHIFVFAVQHPKCRLKFGTSCFSVLWFHICIYWKTDLQIQWKKTFHYVSVVTICLNSVTYALNKKDIFVSTVKWRIREKLDCLHLFCITLPNRFWTNLFSLYIHKQDFIHNGFTTGVRTGPDSYRDCPVWK